MKQNNHILSNETINLISESVKEAINELISQETNDKNFHIWKNTLNAYLKEEIQELQENYLDKLGLKIKINDNYNFNTRGKRKWLAAYERQSRQILDNVIAIAINYPLMYEEMKKRHIEEDEFNIEAQARITIGHEIGHGLVDYIKNLKVNDKTLNKLPNTKIIKQITTTRQEETIAEEFGEQQFPMATRQYDSILDNALEELTTLVHKTTTRQLKENLKTHDDEYNIYEKLDELGIKYDFINYKENIIKIQTPDENTRNKTLQLLNYYGWKNIKDDKHSICAERIYGDEWNNFYDTEAEKDEEDYPYGVGIYYHITLPSKTPKILKQGLTVREGNKLGYKRGKRTYLLSYPSMELACELVKKKEDEKVKVNILLVDIRKYLGKQINLYHDDLTYDEGAVYTYDYIPPQCISIYQTLEI